MVGQRDRQTQRLAGRYRQKAKTNLLKDFMFQFLYSFNVDREL